MRVLVACEFSGIVRDAFARRGHDAWSCDLFPSERPGNHIQDYVERHLDEGWDLMIAHPPCTYLCVPGAHYLRSQPGRYNRMMSARQMFMTLLQCDIERICVENPLPHKKAELPKSDQTIHPWMFGEPFSKRTCLWLKNLAPLKATEIIADHGKRYIRKDGTTSNSEWYAKATQKQRSRTFPGIAEAMAEQWGGLK